MSSRQFALHLFFSGILSLRYPDTNRIWSSVRYDGWDNFPRDMMLILWWPGNMMSCLAPPLAGGPIIIDSFSARLSIHPWGNCKTYSTSYSWWILRVSKVWSSLEDHVMLSRSMFVVLRFSTRTFEANAKCFLLNYPNTVVWVMSWNFSPLPKEFSILYPVVDIMHCLSLGRIYPEICV